MPPALTRGGRLLWPLAVIEEHERALLAADPKAPEVIEMRAAEPARPRTPRRRTPAAA